MKFSRSKGMTIKSQSSLDTSCLALAEIAVESWRLDQTVERVLPRMDPMDAERFASQYRWFRKKVDGALAATKMRIVDLTGQPYSVGTAATPLNIDEFDSEELIVTQMVEPIVMLNGNVVHTGTMLLGPKTM